MPRAEPPVAPRRPVALTHFGDQRIDEYAWLRDRDDPAVLDYLAAENDYAAASLGGLAALSDRVYAEIVSRVQETAVSAPVRWGAWWYYARTYEGRSYPVHCRRAAGDEEYPAALDEPGEQVIVDVNELADGHEFCSLGILEVSPDHRICALGVDFEGAERFALRFVSLDGAPAPPETIEDVGYTAAWARDATSILYVRTDPAWRPYQLWRHELFSDPAEDALVYEEPDERFAVGVGRSRDDEALVVHVASMTSTEVRVTDADAVGALEVLWPRRHGVECTVEHLVAPDGTRWWLALTNDGAADFRVLATRSGDDGAFREVIGGRPGTRIDRVDAFEGHLVISERLDGAAAVRVVALGDGEEPFGAMLERSWLVGSDEAPATTELDASPQFATATVRIRQTSLVTPTTWLDVGLRDGARSPRKRVEVRGGYDEERYCTARIWVTARDGARIPVSICHRRDLLVGARDPGDPPGAPAPLLLYAYGAYEISEDPTFSSARLSLLDRGVIYAIAHVRGGGELGRSWYEQGRLEHKETTFLDLVDVARSLAERGFTEPSRLAALGSSAGGLAVAAAMNLDPEAFAAIVAEVPFVDVVSTMLDESLPLTIGEWEEWGDPLHDPEAYRRIKAWSPYDNVPATKPDGSAVTYPDLFVLAGLNDTRVSYWEPAKWVARLRATSPATNVVLRTDLGAGHSGPSGRYDVWRETALIYAFILDRLDAVGGEAAKNDKGGS